MIRDETTNIVIAGQLIVPKSDSERESSESPPGHSLYDSTNNINQNEETYFINSIPNEDLICYESGNLLNYTSSGLIGFSQEINFSQNIFTNKSEDDETNKMNEHELPNEMPDRKFFPNLEEHDNGKLNFELNLDPNKTDRKNNWYYSKILNKVFIKMDKPFYIDILYYPKFQEEIYLRIIMVYTEDLGSPVTRCSNHLCKDNTINEKEKHSVVRCENNDVFYTGTVEGKNCEDRLAVLIKLNDVPPIDGLCKQSIKLIFVCQNSCIGRKSTALIFSLETRTKMLGKRTVNVKVCSCPKRDKKNDEDNLTQKRNAGQAELLPTGKRPAKIMKIKEEPGVHESKMTSSDNIQANPLSTDIQITPISSLSGFRIRPNGSVQVIMEMPTIRSARKLAHNGFDIIAGEMASDPDNPEKFMKCLKDVKKLRDSI